MTAKLHEVLAVEAELGNISKKLQAESINTFKKDNLFSGMFRELKMFDEAQSFNNTTDRQELTTTVDENLGYITPHVARYWDAVAQKDATNQTAVADIVIGGEVLVAAVSSTTLLGLETKLGEFRKVLEGIPIVASGVAWKKDETMRDGIFVTEHVENSFKTEKSIEFKEASPATKEHRAQVAQLDKTVNVGEYETTKWSGAYTPKRKAEVLANLDILRNAVKKARQRANNTPVVDVHLGETLLAFITQ